MSVVANVAINVDATNAIQSLKRVDQAAKGLDAGLGAAKEGAKGFGAALTAALGPLLAVSTAIGVIQKGLSTAFERGAAEQRLKNLTGSTGEYEAALAAASSASSKFGISQTEATGALADVYGRLKGVGFGLKETTQIYEGFNVAAKQSGISGADAAGVFFQLSQALGKGKLNGDEFVSVAERMPQLMDLIAKETGKSRGELATMAQQGQITSDVLYRALASAAQGAGDLNGKLTTQQQAFNQIAVVSDKLLNSIGQVFAPFVIKGAEALAWAGEKLADWWGYLGSVVFPQVQAAVKPLLTEIAKVWNTIPWDQIVGIVQGIIIKQINLIVGALKLISPVIGFIVGKFFELAQNPVFKFIAEQVGRLANLLGISNDEVAQFKQKQDETKTAVTGTVDQYSSLPPKIEDAKDKTKQLKEAQTAVTKEIEASAQAVDDFVKRQLDGVEANLSITNARIEAEKAVNKVLLEQAQRQLEGAANQNERVKIAGYIRDLTIEQAKLEREAAYASIEAEKVKLEIAVSGAKLKEQEIRLAVALAEVQGKVLQAHYDTLKAATKMVDQAIKQQEVYEIVARYQERAADANFKGAEAAAKSAYQSNIVAKNTANVAQSTASAAAGSKTFADNIERSAISAEKIATSIGSFPVFGGLQNVTDKELQSQIASNIAGLQGKNISRKDYAEGISAIMGIVAGQSTAIPAFAKGGVVSGPTLAMVGEGGEPEYIIPQSKMAEASANYLSGARGNSVVPTAGNAQINVTTGPVLQQNGQQYVTLADLEKAMRKTADGVYASLRTPAGRYATGVR